MAITQMAAPAPENRDSLDIPLGNEAWYAVACNIGWVARLCVPPSGRCGGPRVNMGSPGLITHSDSIHVVIMDTKRVEGYYKCQEKFQPQLRPIVTFSKQPTSGAEPLLVL